LIYSVIFVGLFLFRALCFLFSPECNTYYESASELPDDVTNKSMSG